MQSPSLLADDARFALQHSLTTAEVSDRRQPVHETRARPTIRDRQHRAVHRRGPSAAGSGARRTRRGQRRRRPSSFTRRGGTP
jgi:hypothetical protein